MQKGFGTAAIILAVFTIALFGVVIYYVGVQKGKSNVYVQSSPLPTPPSVNPIDNNTDSLSQTDKDMIKAAVAKKDGQPASEFNVTFDQNNETYGGLFATGQVGPASGAGGGATWYAAKSHGVWIIVGITQSGLPCADTDKYNLPKSLISSCLDSNGNLVNR